MSIFSILIIAIVSLSCKKSNAEEITPLTHEPNKLVVPIGGNAWITNGGAITKQGLTQWESPKSVCKSYVYFSEGGSLKLSLLLNPKGKSHIKVTINGKAISLSAESTVEKDFMVGEWLITEKGYTAIEIQGISKTATSFGSLSAITISGSAVNDATAFVKDNIDNYFYWGRRGPSVHLNYTMPADKNIEWFYNEITVPIGNDVIGSYYMANGFAEGYFGMQVNSETERRILFSIWSPYKTDNPASIPPEFKITLNKKGNNVYSGEFGNEGAGGQSYLVYPWKAGSTYKFLTQAKPALNNSTTYTSYFFSPEENKWLLIASFNRPQTNTYLKRLHSFLENFTPETGYLERKVFFNNQWVMDDKKEWTELNHIKFTADQTARKNFRRDYSGGLMDGKFYLKNCGFFNESTTIDSYFSRPTKGIKPVIDFSQLQ
jgi:hypothetical protein